MMPANTTYLAALGFAIAMLGTTATAHAAITSLTVNRCLAGKVNAVGKSVDARTKCLSKDARRGTSDPACTQKASDKFTGDGTPANGVFEKLEAKYPNTSATPCLTFDDQSTTESDVAAFAAGVPALTGSMVGRCDGQKIKCVGKYVGAVTKCYAKAASGTGLIDTSCTAKASAKLANGVNGCLDKAAARGDCTQGGSQATDLATSADIFVHHATCALDPGNPGCGCPVTYTFVANGADADVDVGWTGLHHDGDLTSNTRVTLAVTGCPNATPPCGTCTLSGPLVNAGVGAFVNRRCRGDAGGANGSWLTCVSDADCSGFGNACVFFFGPPRPGDQASLFGEFCTMTEIATVAGTIDPDAGSVSASASLRLANYVGPTDDPCPLCSGGMCSSGPRAGLPCTVQGHSTTFSDDVSLDCPPSPTFVAATASVILTTGTQTLTLSAVSPPCRGLPAGNRCFCDTCNDANAEPCTSDASCPMSGGNPGICGGKRCFFGGPNTGAPCSANSECPSSACGVPGAATEPNQCDDLVCTPNTPPDNDSVNEGTCAAGPFETFCAMQRYRQCGTNADCPAAGDTCTFGKNRECFTTSGLAGDTVSAGGVASPSAPTLATLYCGPPVASNAVNSIRGLPGLVRMTIPGVATMD